MTTPILTRSRYQVILFVSLLVFTILLPHAVANVVSDQSGQLEGEGWLVVGVLTFSALETALIVGLLVNRSRWRRSEEEAALIADISSRFVNLPAGEVDREVEEAQRRLCRSVRAWLRSRHG